MIPRPGRRAVPGGLMRAMAMAPGVLAVHQLRFQLAFGGNARLALERQGHAYLHSLVPWLVALLAIAAGGFVWLLGRALAGGVAPPGRGMSLLALWVTCTVCLIGLYMAQEGLEGLLSIGHPAGWAGIFGYGGWWALPAAAYVGLLLAMLYLGARRALVRAARYGRAVTRPRRSRGPVRRPAPAARRPRRAVLGHGWSGRGPPLLAVIRP